MQRCKNGEKEIMVRWGEILNIPTFYEKSDLSILLCSPSLLLSGSPILHCLNALLLFPDNAYQTVLVIDR